MNLQKYVHWRFHCTWELTAETIVEQTLLDPYTLPYYVETINRSKYLCSQALPIQLN